VQGEGLFAENIDWSYTRRRALRKIECLTRARARRDYFFENIFNPPPRGDGSGQILAPLGQNDFHSNPSQSKIGFIPNILTATAVSTTAKFEIALSIVFYSLKFI